MLKKSRNYTVIRKMASAKKLLVLDNDFNEYATAKALESSIERLKQEGIEWRYEQSRHGILLSALSQGNYDAMLIDNDFGEGISSLYLARMKHKDIPIAYVSAYSITGLRMQYERMKEARYVNPDDFRKLGIMLLQKPGKNIFKDIPIESLGQGIYSFLKENSDKSKIPERKHMLDIERGFK